MTAAQHERAGLSALLAEVGPEAPTLCGGWHTRDLLAHLILRESRLDAAPGILVPALSGYTDRVQADVAARAWPELLEQFRSGPPLLSPYRLLDAQVNAMEFFVHHEDVRRVRDGWEPRQLSSGAEDGLWRRLRLILAGRLSEQPRRRGAAARGRSEHDGQAWCASRDPGRGARGAGAARVRPRRRAAAAHGRTG